MKFTTKRKRIEKLNDAFIELGIRSNTKVYDRFFDKTIEQSIIEARGEKVSSRAVKSRVQNISIPTREYTRQTYNMSVLSGLSSIVEDQPLQVEDKAKFAPLLILITAYGITRPQVIASKVDKVTKAILSGTVKELAATEQNIAKSLRTYYSRNKKFIQEELIKNKQHIINVNKQIKNNISKTIAKDLKKEVNKRIEVKLASGDVIKRPKTYQEIRTDMRTKYGKQVDYRVRRLVDTEMHSLAETTKFNQHLTMGYTHKRYNTAGDSKVRDVRKGKNKVSHTAMNGIVIPIKDKFKFWGGGEALVPGDPSLPPKQRINCRCDVTYVKRY